MIGTTLGHFQIERKLGAGGMGEVYRARDTRLGRDVAIKLLPATTPEKLARFEREARAVAGLAHPNIVVLHAIEQHAEQHFLVLELVEGQDLTELVAPGGLPLPRVLELVIPLAEALASAHERGVIHRDLKPANVKLARDGRVKVLDFGLARMLENELELEQTMAAPLSEAGRVMGTVPYMAPEQLRGDSVDARADLFALGVIVFELATGRRPFEGRTMMDVSSAILRDPPVQAEISSDLAPIVAACLAKDPRERYQTANELVNALRRLVTGKAAPTARPADQVTIAVLPFANRSASQDDEYFAEGLADELLSVLTRIRGLRVAARTSSGQFKGTNESLSAIGQKLNVATLLEGSVRKVGNRVRIAVQLIRVSDGDAVWSQSYDRTLDDVFAVQDDIAHSVVKELRKSLLGEAGDSDASREAKAEVAKAAAQGRSENPEAQRLLLQARHIRRGRVTEELHTAIALTEQAVALDPSFAAAWLEMCEGHFTFVAGELGDRDFHKERAQAALDRALQLDPDSGEALGQQVWMRLGAFDVKGARESLRHAQRVDPENADVQEMAAIVAGIDGRFDEAAEYYGRAIARDPLKATNYANLALNHLVTGRHDDALIAYRRAIEIAPRASNIHVIGARILIAMGRATEALAKADAETSSGYRLWARALALHALDRHEEFNRDLKQMMEEYGKEFGSQIANIVGHVGDVDRAFEWLERARENMDPGVLESKALFANTPVPADPRWPGFLRSIGLEP